MDFDVHENLLRNFRVLEPEYQNRYFLRDSDNGFISIASLYDRANKVYLIYGPPESDGRRALYLTRGRGELLGAMKIDPQGKISDAKGEPIIGATYLVPSPIDTKSPLTGDKH